MKNLFVLALLIASFSCSAQTLFTYGNRAVSQQEFLEAFLKNKPEGVNEREALNDYLDLFVRFKLKVKAAYDLKIDTLPNQKADLETYRRQIENVYLTDSTAFNKLIDEAYTRSLKDIRLSAIMLPLTSNGKDDSEMTVQKKAADIVQQIRSGKSFESLATAFSADTAAVRTGGDIGFITLFTLPYALENVAYTLETNAVSDPVKVRFGYIIIKKTGERPAVGKIRLAQILIAVDPASSEEEKSGKKKLADSLYATAVAGASFDSLAIRFSNDQSTFATGGIMPEFGVGIFEPAFEEKAFSIKRDDDILPPFSSRFGYHIIKRISYSPIDQDRIAAESVLKAAVSEDSRNKKAQEALEKKMLAAVTIKNEIIDQKQLWRITEEYTKTEKLIAVSGMPASKILFRMPKKNVKLMEWLRYAKTWAAEANNDYPGLMKSFRNFVAVNYYRDHLEDYDPAFKKQLVEFRDGNMLFEIMEKQVWNKAAEDHKGLKTYYDQHKSKYVWEANSNAIMFTAADKSVAEKTITQLKSNPSLWKELAETSEGKLLADSGRFEISQITSNAGSLTRRGFTSVLQNEMDATVNFSYIVDLYPGGEQRSFEEARGMVISDYQQVIEDRWIAVLKKKYPVIIQQQVWNKLLAQYH